eukprot:4977506-Pyramimonas_sp.AAC.1
MRLRTRGLSDWTLKADKDWPLILESDTEPKGTVRRGCNPKFSMRKVTIQKKTDHFLDAATREKANLREALAARMRELAAVKARQKQPQDVQ